VSVIDLNNARKAALRIELVGPPSEVRDALKQVLARISEPRLELIEPDDQDAANVEAAAGDPIDVSMVLFNGDEEKSLAYLQNHSSQTPRPALFGLLKERSPGLMKRVIRAGADELLFLPLDLGDLTRALLKVSETRVWAGRHDGGTVIALSSIVGGVGVSTIAANLALALRYKLDKRIALLDLDLQTGALAVMLNLEPEFTIMPLCRLEKKLDSIQLEAALTKHSSGAYLLAAPKRIEEGELVSDRIVGAVIDSMRDMFDFVIVDCGHHLDEKFVAVCERSNNLIYVLNQTVTSVRSAWRFIDLFKRLSLAVEPHFALNRFQVNHSITQKQLENTLGHPMYVNIARDDKSLELAELSGKDLWQVAAASPLVKKFESLARRLANLEAVVERDKPLMARLFSAFSTHS
jgi:Flp pilus assembly CpaE family ATPase